MAENSKKDEKSALFEAIQKTSANPRGLAERLKERASEEKSKLMKGMQKTPALSKERKTKLFTGLEERLKNDKIKKKAELRETVAKLEKKRKK